ncbi:3,4-dihydroxy-2-butanone-4-phosphate synthase [Rhodococcus chondri]|uniref:3,4-dihydroxy-2-butanone-4-phosphate synthase n=1 Tax=Rhodococcus chondri TaxID=3065941 RepID=A0ABU7JRP2_9NOCA|nr:3,4-dihydroxy-2-butanone-4-phosphate synthase [Rhodococcus sp. CC-R104]MEE2032559.1 3,4-dihydroxy-2-butanone-4-phosphate synthase [Rhodococcus sp. CC-R104]
MTTSVAYAAPTRMLWSTAAEGMCALARGELIILRHCARIVLVGCAGTVTTEQMAFVIRHSTGFVQVALHERDCDRLGLPEATPSLRTPSAPGYGQCVTVDASSGTTTGISGAERAHTARVLGDPRSGVDDFGRPGHVVPVRVNPDVLRDRLTVAASALALTDIALPGFSGAVFADLEGVSDPTNTAGPCDAEALARRYGLTLVAPDEQTER